MAPKVRCTAVQKKKLIEYMTVHPLFANGEYTGPLGSKKQEAQWQKLADELREYGPEKSVSAWKTTWRDLRRRARTDNANANKALVATGNNQPIPDVGEDEEMILSVVGVESSVGLGSQESGIGDNIYTELVKSNTLRNQHIEVLKEQNTILLNNRVAMEETQILQNEDYMLEGLLQ